MDNHFTHVDAAGNARMVDVGEKPSPTARQWPWAASP